MLFEVPVAELRDRSGAPRRRTLPRGVPTLLDLSEELKSSPPGLVGREYAVTP